MNKQEQALAKLDELKMDYFEANSRVASKMKAYLYECANLEATLFEKGDEEYNDMDYDDVEQMEEDAAYEAYAQLELIRTDLGLTEAEDALRKAEWELVKWGGEYLPLFMTARQYQDLTFSLKAAKKNLVLRRKLVPVILKIRG